MVKLYPAGAYLVNGSNNHRGWTGTDGPAEK